VSFEAFVAVIFQAEDLMGCDAVYCYGWIATFQRSMSPPSQDEVVGSMDL